MSRFLLLFVEVWRQIPLSRKTAKRGGRQQLTKITSADSQEDLCVTAWSAGSWRERDRVSTGSKERQQIASFKPTRISWGGEQVVQRPDRHQ